MKAKDHLEYYLNRCPDCGHNTFITDNCRAEIACGNCGAVLVQGIIDNGPEWRTFSIEEANRKVRVGAPTTLTLYDKGLSTTIDWNNKDASGKILSPKMKDDMKRLRKWHIRTRTIKSTDRNLASAIRTLDYFCSLLRLSSNLKESAAHIYRKIQKKNLLKGRSIEAMLIASIYTACKLDNIPRTLDDFLEISSVDRKIILRCYRIILTELKINIPNISAKRLVSRYCEDLNLSQKTEHIAIIILDLAKKFDLTLGKDPKGLCAGAIYLAGLINNEHRTQRDISKTTGVAEATVRSRYKEFLEIPGISSKIYI